MSRMTRSDPPIDADLLLPLALHAIATLDLVRDEEDLRQLLAWLDTLTGQHRTRQQSPPRAA